MRIAACGLVGLTLFLSACASVIGLDEGVLDEGVLDGGVGDGGVGDGGLGEGCPSGRGPAMVRVPGPDGVGSDYCMDRTEVTAAQYDEWLNQPPDPAKQPAICSFNTDFKPSPSGTYCGNYMFAETVADDGNEPMRCADWCDATAFCQWAGKRLCGKIGGGTNPQSAALDANSSEWYRACSRAGERKFPYGDAYDKKACVGADFNDLEGFQPMTDYPHDVGSFETCQGGYEGLFDMSGNLQEWEGSCNVTVGKDDKCYARGGAYRDSIALLSCSDVAEYSRGVGAIMVGFRCCADVK